jgi:hypothetical protein
MYTRQKKLIFAAFCLYLTSLIFPINGQWFSGFGLMLASLFGSIWMAGALFNPSKLTAAQMVALPLVLLMPLYNPLIIYGLVKLRQNTDAAPTWLKNITLIACATAALMLANMAYSYIHTPGSRSIGILFAYACWFCSLLLVTIRAWLPKAEIIKS